MVDDEEKDRAHRRVAYIVLAVIAIGILVIGYGVYNRFRTDKPAVEVTAPAVPAAETATRRALPVEAVAPDCEARLYDQATAERTNGQELTPITTATTGQEVGAAIVCSGVPDGTVVTVAIIQPETGQVIPGSLTMRAINSEYSAAQGAFTAGVELPPGHWLFGFELDGEVVSVLELTII